MNPNVEIRQATAADIEGFYGIPTRSSCLAWVAFWKGKPACLAGIAFEDVVMVGFSMMKEDIDAPPITVWRTAKILLELIKSKGFPLFAKANERKHNSGKFLESLGFVLAKAEGSTLIYRLPT